MTKYWLAPVLCLLACAAPALGDGAECNGWGEFRGIRVGGQLSPFTTSVKLAGPDGKITAFSATQTIATPQFTRNGDTQTSSATIGGGALAYRQIVQDTSPGTVAVTISVTANRALTGAGVFYYVTLPADLYSGGTALHMTPEGPNLPDSMMVTLDPRPAGETYRTLKSRGIRITAPGHAIDLECDHAVDFTVLRDKFIDTDYKMQPELSLPVDPQSLDRIAFCFPLITGNLAQGQQATATFTIKTTATLDQTPVTLALDRAHPGASFDGIGGNFRIQSPQDQAHLTYNLDNLRVAWGRVEMPLAAWAPQEGVDPAAPSTATAPATASAPAAVPGGRGGRGGRGGGGGGPGNQGVRQAMEMAGNLAKRNIPFFISTWGIPGWANAPSQRKPDQPRGIQAGKFNPDKMPAVYQAIGSYLKYLKANYQAEPAAFSFNESDLGINVLFTPQEHAALIKGLGKYLESQGLKTKMLLADAASPHPLHFIDAAMADPECRKYIGAISFHSWHDGTTEEFAAWGKAARELNVPLFCGEGGLDADAHQYPQIFSEPWFCLHEIDTYLSILQYGQAASVLHWQLTENYGILASRNGTLTPTRRFFQLKQLDLTPPGAPFLPLVGNAPGITHAAYGDAKHGYAIHLLNNGAQRVVTLTGIPNNIKQFHVFATDASRQMQELARATVTPGTAQQDPPPPGTLKVTLDAETLTTLTVLPAKMGPEALE